ncbi:cell division protein FtsQ/DivIB [Promicromonospora iranensis]|uniref:cell division protein FtsQ/DivIB n=1 Tax=Promicromonospora iranensis TaxID=1105144 RepID=UPI0023A97170|nr:cell division protein FtsQ/DivIB [Promicromonospora iranensis]
MTARGTTGQGPAQESAQRAAAPARPGRRTSGAQAPGRRPPASQQVSQRTAPPRTPASRPDMARTSPSGTRHDVVSDQLADRLAERTAMARYRVWRRIGWTALALAVTTGLVWATFFSPLLALDPEQVRVSGQGTTVDVGQVRETVTDQAGVPLPRIDTVGLREEILAMNAVKDVEITRAWPDGLAVRLTSREPVAAVPQQGDVHALMDAEGVRVGTAKEVPDNLPSIVVSLANGEAGRRAMNAALEVLGALPRNLAGDIQTVSAATQDDVRTTLKDGRVIRWGSGAQVELKTKVAQTLLRAEPSATTIDVSSPALPVTR